MKIKSAITTALVLIFSITSTVFAFNSGENPEVTGPNNITWTGNGVTDGDFNKVICPADVTLPDGIDPYNYIHWIFTTDGGSAENAKLHLGGSGSGVYSPYQTDQKNFHFYTPYFDLATITAYADFNVLETGNGSWVLTVSHGCHSQTVRDLTVSKTAAPTYTRTFDWTIEKDADVHTIYTADSATVKWTVTVTKDAGTDSDWAISGIITVHNPNDFEVDGVAISDATPGGDCVVSSASLDVPAGGDAKTDYTCTFTSNPGSGTNTATATWPEIGSPNTSGTGTANYVFGEPTTITNDEIDVTDTNGGSWHFTDSGSIDYEKTYNDPAGTCTDHDNTAKITQTGASSTDSVEVCVGADLKVTKDATPKFQREYSWDISKAVDKTLVKQVGGSATFNYSVKAWETGFTDSLWAVSGNIHVVNPNDWEAITFDATDVLPDASCNVTGGVDVVLDASDSVDLPYSCTYASQPAYATDLINTATVTWDKDVYYTPNSSASGEAKFQFTTPTKTVNKTITVTDTFKGVTMTLGTLTATNGTPLASATYNYSYTVAVPTWDCVSYTNTAKIVETGQKASKTITVCGPMKTAARTMGYWQNNNGQAIIKSQAIIGVCPSGTWLRQFAPFQDLSATASCSQVASYVYNVIKSANASGASMNAMLKGQMLATALDVYFSDPALGGNKINAPAPIGGISIDLTKICKDLTCAGFESVTSVFGGSSSKTVMELLTYAASQSNVGGSMWYGNIKTKQELVKDTFDAINNQKVFAP